MNWRWMWLGAAAVLGVATAWAASPAAAGDAGSAAQFRIVPGGHGDRVFVVECDSAPLIEALAQAWDANFKWAGTQKSFGQRDADKALPLNWKVDLLGISGTGKLISPQTNVMRLAWDLTCARSIARQENVPHAKGGLTLMLNLDSPARRGHKALPVLKEDRTGLRWEVLPGRTITIAFAQPLPELYFEQNQPSQVRASLYAAPIEAGALQQAMTVTLPEGGVVTPTLDEEYSFDAARGITTDFDVNQWPVDLSFLNEKPAGTHGAVHADGDRLVFADGTPARFWGVGLTGASVSPLKDGKLDKALVDTHARRIARLGFNLVRFTQMDSWWCQPNLLEPKGPTSDRINEAYLDAMHYFIAALKREGVYVQLDMTTFRPYFAGDGIEGFEEMRKDFPKEHGGALAEGAMYLNPRLRELWRLTTRELLTRKNPYTGLAVKDDPAVASLVTLNENDLTVHYANLYLDGKGRPVHRALLLEKLQAFAKRTGLSEQELGKTWLPGVNKLLLNDIEYQWQKDAADYLRELGFKGVVVTGHVWGVPGVHALPSLLSGDVTDMHAYSEAEFLSTNPHYMPNFLHLLTFVRVADRPTWISEYNMEPTRYDNFTAMPYMAAMAAFQGWDAPTLYGYSQDGFAGWPIQSWSAYRHPSILALSPAAALMYRAGHVQPAKQTVYVPLSREQAFLQGRTAGNTAAFRTIMERHGVCVGFEGASELPWLKPTQAPPGAQVQKDLDRDDLPPGTVVKSDTGEFYRDFGKGVFVVDTPKTQLVMGRTAGNWSTADIAWEIGSPIAGVSLSSLDDAPLKDSRKMVLCSMGRVLVMGNTVSSERVDARLRLRTSHRALRLLPLKPDGTTLTPVTLPAAAGRVEVVLPADAQTHWYMLVAESQ